MNKVAPQKCEIQPLHCRSEPVDGVDIPTAKKPSVAQEGARVKEGIPYCQKGTGVFANPLYIDMIRLDWICTKFTVYI